MALSRLLFSEAELRLPNTGLSKPSRWFTAPLPSSSSSSTQKKVSKISEATKEERTEAVKSFLQSYMEKHPGQFPKTKEVQNAVGGSRNLLKEILSELRNRMLTEPAVILQEETREETNLNFELKELSSEISPLSEQSSDNNGTNTIEEKCPKLDHNCSQIEGEIKQIRPSIEEKLPILDMDTCNASVLASKEDTMQDLSGAHTRTSSLFNVMKGLKNGPKSTSTEIKLGSLNLKDDLSGEGELRNDTKRKYVDNLVRTFKGLGKNNGINVNLQTSKFRERKREDFDGVKSLINVIIEKDTIDQKRNLNFVKFQDSFSVLNPNPNPKGEGLTDFLNKRGGNEKFTERTEAEEGPIFKENEKCKYGLFVRFLDKITRVNDICGALGGLCGPIESVRILPSEKYDSFNCATVFFKTEKGLKTALQITDSVICKKDVALEPMTSEVQKGQEMGAELALQDPDFPANLLKCPSRSVVVKGLTKSISFDQLRFSLGPFGPISGLAMGQSGSSVYVQFVCEEWKEKALEAAKIEVSGKILKIYRVYVHKTSVLRISNVNGETSKYKIQSMCGSYGKIKKVVQRNSSIFDVHFNFSELPNVLTILNRLNGLVVDKNQWVVQPSTFLPVGIIQSMWNSEEGRKQMREIFQNICAKINVERNCDSISPLMRLSKEW